MNGFVRSALFVTLLSLLPALSTADEGAPWLPRYLADVAACRDAYQGGDIVEVRRTCGSAIKLAQGSNKFLVPPLNLLGLAEKSFGSPNEAVGFLQKAIRLLQATEPEDRQTMATLKDNLGLAYVMIGRSADALALFDEDLKVFSQSGQAKDAAASMANRVVALENLRRTDEALSAARDAAVGSDSAFGPASLEAARARINIADILGEIGRSDEALNVLNRATEIIKVLTSEQQSGDVSPDLAYAERSIGTIMEDQGKHADAISHLSIAERILAKVAPDGADYAAVSNNLGIAFENSGLLPEAMNAYEVANRFFESEKLDTAERAVTEDHLGRVLTGLGRCDEGKTHTVKAIALLERLLGSLATDTIIAHANLALNLRKCSGIEASLEEYRRATDSLSTSGALLSSAVSSTDLRQQERLRDIYFQHLMALAKVARSRTGGPSPDDIRQALRLAQLADATTTSVTVAQRAAAGGTAGAALSDFFRIGEEWRKVEHRLVDAVAKSDSAGAKSAKEALAQLSARSSSLSEDSGSDRLAVLADTRPATIETIRGILKDGDAMMLIIPGEQGGVGITITKADSALYIVDTAAAAVESDVAKVRSGLADESSCASDKPFDKDAAFRLYRDWFAPAEAILSASAITHVLYSAGGALAYVPPDVFVTSERLGGLTADGGPSPGEETAWLVRKYAFSIEPSASAAVTVLSRNAVMGNSLLGIGSPVLGNEDKIDCTSVWLGLRAVSIPKRVDQLPNLNDVGDVLVSMMDHLKYDHLLLVGDQATFNNITHQINGRYKTIVFATHGLMGGSELEGLDEPALVITPSGAGRGLDGLLRTSDIINWDSGADAIILVACNSAAADPQTGEISLSGLVRAFFSSGARSVVASYWHTPVDAGSKMLPGLIGLTEEANGVGKARMLRNLKLGWLKDQSMSSPRNWAAFQIIGAAN